MGVKARLTLIGLFLSVFVLNTECIFAQEIIDTVKVEREGRTFYIHQIQQGNTLYSIAKTYKVSVKDIEEFNPSAKHGLNIGDTLFILAISEDKESKERQMEVDANIMVHEVQKGQILYSISKIYEISTADILAVNPKIKKGLKVGQLVKIPIGKLKKEVEEIEEVVEKEPKFEHKVKPGETLYSISRYYGVGVDQLKEYNEGMTNELSIGQVIKIPLTKEFDLSSADTTEMKETYNVALILPFFLAMNDTLMSDLKIGETEKVLAKSKVGIQFYQGFKLAIDSLNLDSNKFRLKIFDGAKDTSVVGRMIRKGELDSMDLIVGPLFFSQFLEVAKFARKNKIHIVCPVPQNNKILLGNPYVSKVATSQNIQYKKLASHLSKFYWSENVIVVTKNFRANELSFSFKEELQEQLEHTGDTSSVVQIKELKWDNGSIESVKNELNPESFNIIILPSDDQAYVTEFLSQLNVIRKDFMFMVVGIDRWLRYTNIDFEYFEHLNVMMPVDGFVDYDNEGTKNFIKAYYKKYEIFPEKYSLIGADIGFYYLGLLESAGTRFETKMLKEKKRMMYFKFDFFKTGIESGYENRSVFFLNQEDFKLEEITTSGR